MPSERDTVPTEALADVAYLVRSENRVRILETLARGPFDRRELQEETGSARTTLDRIVNELETRGWATRRPSGEYVATQTGARLVAQFRPFLDAVAAIRRLGDAVAWLPTGEDAVSLEHLRDATVRRPEQADPIETVDYFVELTETTTELHVLTHLAPPAALSEAIRAGLEAGELTATFVVASDTVEYVRDHPTRRDRWASMLRADATLARYEGTLPCNLFAFDGTVLIKQSVPEDVHESYGVPIVSENEAVRRWALDLVDRHRAAATPVPAEAFAEPAPEADADEQ